MYFHAGQDFVLNTRDVLGVFDLDTAGASRRTGDYLRRAEQEGAVVDLCAPGTLPKSFLVTDFPGETVYVSPPLPRRPQKTGGAFPDRLSGGRQNRQVPGRGSTAGYSTPPYLYGRTIRVSLVLSLQRKDRK